MTTDPGPGSDAGGPSRWAILAALTLAVAVIGVVLTLASRSTPPRDVTVAAVDAPQAESPACQSLGAALPQRLGDFQRVALAQPAPPGASAWRAVPGSNPVVLRCGLDRPADFVVGSPLEVVDGVQWFKTSAAVRRPGNAGGSTWCAVDRSVYVALTLPAESGPTPIQQLSEVIGRVLPAVPIQPAAPK